jgi:hypothetical protein
MATIAAAARTTIVATVTAMMRTARRSRREVGVELTFSSSRNVDKRQ